MKGKENKVLELFFSSPKYWHFEELKGRSGLSRSRLTLWLKSFEKDGLIKRTKPRGKMPYYTGVFENPDFRYKKRMFAFNQMVESGLLRHLSGLKKAKAVIIFGSFSRFDWYEDSDIDIFIYGNDEDFEQGKYELKLNRDIQVHLAKKKKDLKKIDRMIPYIISGDFIKGFIEDLRIKVNV